MVMSMKYSNALSEQASPRVRASFSFLATSNKQSICVMALSCSRRCCAGPPRLRRIRLPAPPLAVRVVIQQAPDFGPRIMSNYYKLQYQLYTTGTKCATVLFRRMQVEAGERNEKLTVSWEPRR
jgi:hypothetical protein